MSDWRPLFLLVAAALSGLTLAGLGQAALRRRRGGRYVAAGARRPSTPAAGPASPSIAAPPGAPLTSPATIDGGNGPGPEALPFELGERDRQIASAIDQFVRGIDPLGPVVPGCS